MSLYQHFNTFDPKRLKFWLRFGFNRNSLIFLNIAPILTKNTDIQKKNLKIENVSQTPIINFIKTHYDPVYL